MKIHIMKLFLNMRVERLLRKGEKHSSFEWVNYSLDSDMRGLN